MTNMEFLKKIFASSIPPVYMGKFIEDLVNSKSDILITKQEIQSKYSGPNISLHTIRNNLRKLRLSGYIECTTVKIERQGNSIVDIVTYSISATEKLRQEYFNSSISRA